MTKAGTMMPNNAALHNIVVIAGAVLATVLQVFLAPHIAIGYAQVNFMVAFCMAVAVASASTFSPVLPFLLGLVYDLLSGGPVGAMAFTLTALSTVASHVYLRANNDTRFMALSVLAAGVLLVELCFGGFYLLLGYAADFPEALAYRIVPCFAYDAVISVGLYFVLERVLRREAPLQSEIKQLQ